MIPLDPTTLIVITIVIALLFDFTNGWNDDANAVATIVSTRVLKPYTAVIMAAILNFAGAFLGTAVAKAISGKIVEPKVVSEMIILSAMAGAAVWVTICTRIGLPISCSHTLMGGLIGASLAGNSWDFGILKMEGITPIIIAIFASPILSFIAGYLLCTCIMFFFRKLSLSKVNRIFGPLQMVSAGFMSLNHGMNDAQKVMGVITLALFSGGFIGKNIEGGIEVPIWVIAACATAIALGTAVGGWRVIRTLGMKLVHIKPYQGFSAETGASIVLLTAAQTGIPVSTTHNITGAIVGVGTAQRFGDVSWLLGWRILIAWLLTIPTAAIFSAGFFYVVDALFRVAR